MAWPKRVQYLSVAVARHVFQHAKHGIVFVRDAISTVDARKFGLSPILLYSVNIAGTHIHWNTFSPLASPIALSRVLIEAWDDEDIRGYPDIVMISRRLAESSQQLAINLSRLGIEVQIAAGNNRQFSAAIRTAQTRALDLTWSDNEKEKITNIDQLKRCSASQRRFRHEVHLYRIGSDKSRIAAIEAHFGMPNRSFQGELSPELDWKTGPWLTSWENNLPPCTQRHLAESRNATWLFTGPSEESKFESSEDNSTDSAPEKVKIILGCWPNKPAEVARAAGITLRDLNWYIGGKQQLESHLRSNVLSLLGIEANEYGDYDAEGPCILLASTIRATVSVYEEITHGGDLEFSFEIEPEQGPADPSWRYIVLRSCGGRVNFLMAPRGGDVAEKLGEKHFINFGGILAVSRDLYRDVVSTCAKGAANPRANLLVAQEFELRRMSDMDALCNEYARF